MKPDMLFYIETLGCQMNKLDSELVAGLLARLEFRETPEPEQADVAILNTCSVRDHAEQKALSRLGHFNHLRRRHGKPTVIAIMGCFAQRDPEHIRQKAPFIDIICGPNQIHQLGDLIQTVWQERELHQKHQPRLAVEDFRKIRSGKSEAPEELENLDLARPMGENQYQRFVRAQRGCDKFCSYCVVPYVRGPEISRPAEHILEEIRRIGQTGCQEITLIGQTINSYRDVSNGQTIDLPELLYRVHAACGIPRIRFITSYPAEFSVDIFQAMRELPRICPYLHLPAQHGANRVLAAMNRKYTVEEYLEILDQGRKIVPNLSVAGDFIVGFPTETDEDHQQSITLLEKVRYKNCFIFKYSTRPGTLAEKKYADQVPPEKVSARHSQMLETQDRISDEDNQTLIGTEVLVLVEGPSKKNRAKEGDPKQLVGRTAEDKIVIFTGPESAIGKIENIKITSASSLTLFGERVK
jgi:tRNA-2-methylthio-N6-dimethylallyladenosine synthase